MRNHVRHLKEVSPYYQQLLKETDPSDIKRPEDIEQLPFTNKQILSEKLPSFRAVEADKIVETVVTSGSTGLPLVFVLSASDLDRLAFNEALSFWAAGVTAGDRAQIVLSVDRLLMAGMSYYRGLTALCVNTMRVGVLPFEMQKQFLTLLKPTVLVGIPSYLKKFALLLQNGGFDLKHAGIEKIFCVGESIRDERLLLNNVGTKLEELFNAQVYSTYSVTELSITYGECSVRQGNHAHPELVYTEIVDEQGKPVSDNNPGELVATTFGVEGIPLLRYRTGDITYRIKGNCSCSRNSERIGPILGRKSQMIKIKGTAVYPMTITAALDELDCIEDYVVLLEGDDRHADQVFIHVAAAPANVETIASHIRTRTRVSIPILISNAATINSHRAHAKKRVPIVDKRKKK